MGWLGLGLGPVNVYIVAVIFKYHLTFTITNCLYNRSSTGLCNLGLARVLNMCYNIQVIA